MLWLRFLYVSFVISSVAQAQVGSWAFNFSSSPSTFFPPQFTNTSSCQLSPSSSPFFVVNIASNTLPQSAIYEINALSNGPLKFYVAIYANDFDSESPCDYFSGYLRNSVRPFGNTAYPVDAFIYLAKQTEYNLVVYVESTDNSTEWDPLVMLNLFATTHTGITNNNTYWSVEYTGDYDEPDCSVVNASVPYVVYQWQFSRPSGFYDIHAALDYKQPGVSVGLFNGALAPARLHDDPCSFYLGGNNGGDLGGSLFSNYLQQNSFYTIVISNFNNSNSFYGIQIAETNVIQEDELYSGFTPANYSLLGCTPSTSINDSYWYSYWFRDYFSKELAIFVSSSDDWQVFAYAGDNSGINSTYPPETCPVWSILIDYAPPSSSIVVNTIANQFYTFLISSTKNSADVTNPNFYLAVFESSSTATTTSTGLTSSTTSRITITTTGNSTSDTSSTSSTTGSSTSFSTSFMPSTSTSDASSLSVSSLVLFGVLLLLN